MQLEDYFDFLAPDDIRQKGHRIGIEHVLYEYIHNAQTPEEIAARFPTLSLEQVYATILYYLHNQEAVDRYLADPLQIRGQAGWSTAGGCGKSRSATRRRPSSSCGGLRPNGRPRGARRRSLNRQ